MKQLFHAVIPTNDPKAVEAIKKDIGAAASEMGFNHSGSGTSYLGQGWTVTKVDNGWRVEGEFYT